MTAGRALGYLAAIVILSTCCILTLMCGIVAGGVVGFFTGGAAGWAGGWGSRLPEQRWQMAATPTPRTQNVPRATVTPQPMTPRRTPQATPQAPRAPFPADQTGALIQVVDAGSPAEKAGLRVNDLVTQVNGATINENHTLTDLIRAKKPGDTVTLTVLRGAQTLKLEAVLGTRKLESGAEVASLGVTFVAWPMAGPAD